MSSDINESRLFVGGRWIAAARSTDAIDPYTGRRIASVPSADERIIDSAVESAHAAFETMRRLAPFERATILSRVVQDIERRRDELASTILAEAGKPITLAEAEVDRAVVTFTCAAEEARRFSGEVLDMEAFAPGRGHFGTARRFPVGVVYGITPFNFPLNLVAHKVAPALASGNTIIIKPSPRTPLTALLLASILEQARTPPGAVNVINTSNELAAGPIHDQRVKHVSFTGSVPVGWKIKEQAARKRVTLELGGNAGLIIHEDADFAAAIPAAATGAFAYAGQSCISVQRIFVQESIYGRFRDAFVEHVRQHIHAGDPRERRTVVGPLIDSSALERVQALLDNATRSGAQILTGGTFNGPVLSATVIENADPKLDICTTEAFAPIATLHPYDSFDRAIQMVNDSKFGLQAGVFTRDIARAFEAFENLEVGGVMINQVPTFRADNMPYGGVKASGLGREGVRYAMEEMTEMRMMVIKK